MRITTLIVALIAAGTLTAVGQDGTAENIKQGAKKAGHKIKQGVETVGEKTKDAAETVGQKTKEAAETVGKKTKQAAETVTGKTDEGTTTHRKSGKTSSSAKTQRTGEQPEAQQSNTVSPSPR